MKSAALTLSLSQDTYDYGRVPGCVFGDHDAVVVLLPLRRLVLYVGDGDCQLHRRAPVSAVGGHDVPGDIGPLRIHKQLIESIHLVYGRPDMSQVFYMVYSYG